MDKSTIIVRDFNRPSLIIDRKPDNNSEDTQN
jgi:hypothetical protein